MVSGFDVTCDAVADTRELASASGRFVMDRFITEENARVQYVDVVLAFVGLVSFGAVSPWVYTALGMSTDQLDPLSAVLLQLIPPMMVIGMIISVGVSARSG